MSSIATALAILAAGPIVELWSSACTVNGGPLNHTSDTYSQASRSLGGWQCEKQESIEGRHTLQETETSVKY